MTTIPAWATRTCGEQDCNERPNRPNHPLCHQCYPPPHALSPPILTKIRIQVATSHPTSQAILTGYTLGY